MRKLLILITLCLPVVVWAQDMRKITGQSARGCER